jgi:malate dehydrogenase (oxaloacetate-decarboxylating)
MDYYKESLKLHKKHRGKIEIKSKVKIENKEDLALAYSPGVAAPSLAIKDGDDPRDYTAIKNSVAVISDGTAVLGLGNIGPEAALPVMEGKALLFKEFAGIDAFPIVLNTKDVDEIVQTIKNIAPTFGGINLEDISAPRCFEIEERLIQELDIPVFHDDQHGTAIVVLAGLINALKLTGKIKENVKVVINGSGAAGIAITRLLYQAGIQHITLIDSGGIVSKCREDLNLAQKRVLECCVMAHICGELKDVIMGTDVFIGVSVGGVLSKDMVRSMAKDPIIFALANPEPEIAPEDAYDAGAKIVATGRSDYPNQVNNVLVFPGIFKGALVNRVNKITSDMKLRAAQALAEAVDNLSEKNIIPDPFDKRVVNIVANALKN